MAGPQEEVIRVRENDVRIDLIQQGVLGDALNGRLRAHGHENRGFDGPVRCMQQAGTGFGVRTLGDDLEAHLHHGTGR